MMRLPTPDDLFGLDVLPAWIESSASSNAGEIEDDPLARDPKPRETPHEIARVKAMLDVIDPDVPRDAGWFKAIQAIHWLNWSCGEDLARDWSAASDRFDAREFRRDWRSLSKKGRRGKAVTIRSLAQMAMATGRYVEPADTSTEDEIGDGWLARMNRRYAQVHLPPDIVIVDKQARSVTHGRVETAAAIMRVAAFHLAHKGELTDEPKPRPITEAWLGHRKRRRFAGMHFAPPPAERVEGFLNLWRGFAVEPRPGDISPWMELLHALIDDPRERTYVENWLAWNVQNPGLPAGTVPALTGPEGTGKNSLIEPVVRIFGRHGAIIDSPDLIVGRFTFHLIDKSIVVLDEASFAGDPREADRLKARITGTTQVYEPKGLLPVVAENRASFVMLSNHEHVARMSAGDRRYVPIETSSSLIGDRSFWGRFHVWARSDAGLAALLHHLQDVDLAGFEIRDIPKGAARRRQIEMTASRDAVVSWLRECLDAGRFVGAGLFVESDIPEGGGTVTRGIVRASYESFVERGRSFGLPPSFDVAVQRARALIGIADGPRRRTSDGRERTYLLPPLQRMVAAFEHAAGIRIDRGDDDEI